MSSSIRKQKSGFRVKAGRRQTLFIRGDNLEECLQKYCQRTGAEMAEFQDSISELRVPVEEPEPKPEPEPEPGEENGEEAVEDSVPEVAAEIEASGKDIPDLEARIEVEGGL